MSALSYFARIRSQYSNLSYFRLRIDPFQLFPFRGFCAICLYNTTFNSGLLKGPTCGRGGASSCKTFKISWTISAATIPVISAASQDCQPYGRKARGIRRQTVIIGRGDLAVVVSERLAWNLAIYLDNVSATK